MIICKRGLSDRRIGHQMTVFRWCLCILDRVILPSQGMLLAELDRNTGSHDLILNHVSEREFEETKTSFDLKLSQDLGDHKKTIPPSTGISPMGCVQTVFYGSLLKDLRELVYTFLGAFAPCQALNKWSGISSPSLGGRRCGCTESTDGKPEAPEARWEKPCAPGHTAEIWRLVFWVQSQGFFLMGGVWLFTNSFNEHPLSTQYMPTTVPHKTEQCLPSWTQIF